MLPFVPRAKLNVLCEVIGTMVRHRKCECSAQENNATAAHNIPSSSGAGALVKVLGVLSRAGRGQCSPRKPLGWGLEMGRPRGTEGGMYVLGVGKLGAKAALIEEVVVEDEEGDDVFLFGDLAMSLEEGLDVRVDVDVVVAEEERGFASKLGVVGDVQDELGSEDGAPVRHTDGMRRAVEVIVIEDDESEGEEERGGGVGEEEMKEERGGGVGDKEAMMDEEEACVAAGVPEEEWPGRVVLEDFDELENSGVKSKHFPQSEELDRAFWYDEECVEVEEVRVRSSGPGVAVVGESERWDLVPGECEAGESMVSGVDDSYTGDVEAREGLPCGVDDRYAGDVEAREDMQFDKDDSHAGDVDGREDNDDSYGEGEAAEDMQCGKDDNYVGDVDGRQDMPCGNYAVDVEVTEVDDSHAGAYDASAPLGSDVSAGQYLEGLDVDMFFADDTDTTQSQGKSRRQVLEHLSSSAVHYSPTETTYHISSHRIPPPTDPEHYSAPYQLTSLSPSTTHRQHPQQSVSKPPNRPSFTHLSNPTTLPEPPMHRTPLHRPPTHHSFSTPQHNNILHTSHHNSNLHTSQHNPPSTPRTGLHPSLGSLPCSLDAHLAAMPNFALGELDSEEDEDLHPGTPQLEVRRKRRC